MSRVHSRIILASFKAYPCTLRRTLSKYRRQWGEFIELVAESLLEAQYGTQYDIAAYLQSSSDDSNAYGCTKIPFITHHQEVN